MKGLSSMKGLSTKFILNDHHTQFAGRSMAWRTVVNLCCGCQF